MEQASVWLYTRKSRALGDPDDPSLLAAHLSALHRLAAEDGHQVAPEQVHHEIGSGESISDRPVFSRLLAEWEALPPGAGGTLYCLDQTRLSRGDPTQTGRIEIALKRAGILVHTTERVYDLNRADDQLFMEFNAALAHYHNTVNKRLVALKRAEMTREGLLLTGKPPRGYRWVKSPGQQDGKRVPGRLEADPDWFPILVSICREVLTVSIRRLGEKYGIHPACLRAVLKSPIICGFPARRHAHHQGTRAWKKKYQPLPREQWTWPEQPGDYPAACTREEWERIQQVLEERSTWRLKTGFLDRGWAKAVVVFVGWPGRTRLGAVPLPPRGQVPTYEQDRPKLPKLYVERAPVDAVAVTAIRAFCSQPAVLTPLFDQLEAERQRQRQSKREPGEAPLRAQFARERTRLATLKHEAADPDCPEEDREANGQAQGQCRARLTALKALLEQAQSATVPLPDLTLVRPLFAELSGDFDATWEALTGAQKQEVLLACVKEIPVTITPLKGRRYRREVGEAVFQDWWICYKRHDH